MVRQLVRDRDNSNMESGETGAGVTANVTDEELHARARAQLKEMLSGAASDFPGALQRYTRWHRTDPFADIEPALLNSADFCEYIIATGMMWPFNPDIGHIKTAALELRLSGTVVYWTEKGERVQRQLNERTKPFLLCANSIAFVTLEPYLQIPEYIALRFNLRVSNVYRGLLLGTGPIIDPGYQGRLSVPLHNLTTNEYMFSGGETLIAVEFTKLSPTERWKNEAAGTAPVRVAKNFYTPYPAPENADPEKTERNVVTQVVRAEAHRPIRSTVATTVALANQAMDRVTNFGWIAAVFGLGSIALTVGSLGFALYGVTRVVTDASAVSKAAAVAVARQDSLRQQMKSQSDSTRKELVAVRAEIAKLRDARAAPASRRASPQPPKDSAH